MNESLLNTIPEPPLARALAFQKAGRFDDAERVYTDLLSVEPTRTDALTYLGVLLLHTGRFAEGMERLDASLKIQPAQPLAWVKRGNAIRERKRYDEAIANYGLALTLKPDYAEAHYHRAHCLAKLSRYEEALAGFNTALTFRPDSADAHSSRGNILRKLKRFSEALADYDKAVALKPLDAEVLSGRGIVLSELKRFEEALASYDRALEINPDCARAYYGRGRTQATLQETEDALVNYEHALTLDPDDAEIYVAKSGALVRIKRYEDALENCDKALALEPAFSAAYNNRGFALKHLKRVQEAQENYIRAVELGSMDATPFINLGELYKESGMWEKALICFRQAFELWPDGDYVFGNLLAAKMGLCEWDNLEQDILYALRKTEQGKLVSNPWALLAIPSTASHQLQAATCHASVSFPRPRAPLWNGEAYDHDRLRVAYFSADFGDHPVSFLTAGLFERHARSKFEIFGFSLGEHGESKIRQRLDGAFDRLIDVRDKSEREIAELAHSLEIDIAVDLGGYTKNARTGIFSFRPAPIQVNFLGYAGTLGADFFDYIVADDVVIPRDSRHYFREKIAYLPHSFQPNDHRRYVLDHRPTRAELGLPEDGFVFCCYNNHYKITPDVFDIWMRLLTKVDGSVVWLSGGDDAKVRALRAHASKRGVAPERLVFADRVADHADHLARLQAADLFLDTFYYNAHTTTSDALWSGLPVITRPGDALASRVAASLVHAVGLGDLVARDSEEYEHLAFELATDRARLTATKERLWKNRLTHPLFDQVLYTRHLEEAFCQMSARQRANLPPDHIFVQDDEKIWSS